MALSPEIPVLYGSMSFFLTISHNIFLLYYVDMFVSVYRIDKVSFWIGEVLFLLWNSLNDPLFGWLSDKFILQSDGTHKKDIVLHRLQSLSFSGPLFAASFSLFWIPWFSPALQFAICLCLYDGFLTAVDLQHTALLADFAVHAKERAKLNKQCSIFSACGSVSVFLSYMFWNKQNIFSFQIFCSVLAILSMLGFLLSTRILLKTYVSQGRKSFFSYVNSESERSHHVGGSAARPMGLKKYAKQLACSHNFMWFTSMNVVQVFHCHFNSNFFPLFLDALVGDAVAPGIGPLLIGFSFVLPHVNNIYFLTLCERHGLYHVIRGLFAVKLGLAVFMLCVGSGSVWLLCLFIASNRIFTEGTCKLLNLVISDLVDEDFVRHKRDQAASAVLFGMSSLLSKPGQTMAPLVGTWLLTMYTGEDVFQSNASPVDAQVHGLARWPDRAVGAWMSRRDACFLILVTVPIVCSLLQLAAWSRFTLRGSRLHEVKTVRLRLGQDLV